MPHRLYLVDGDPGAGKTTLALQYLIEGAKRGERCLYITLSETKEELLAGALSHGWSLEGVDIVELTAEEHDLDSDSQITMYPAAEVELHETTKMILNAVEKVNPSRVVFDSLSELRLLAQSSLRYRRQILALKQFFIGRKSTVLLLDDKTSEGSDLHLQSIAHAVLSLEQLAPVFGAARRRLRVIKFRGTDYRGGYHDFAIRRGGLEVFPRLVAVEHRASFERGRIESGVSALVADCPPAISWGTPVRMPRNCDSGSLRWIPSRLNRSSRMLSSCSPLRFFTTEMAFFTFPAYSK
jgi:circadian clock protein KaiC